MKVEGAMPSECSTIVEEVIWEGMRLDQHGLDPAAIGLLQDGAELRRSESPALTRLLPVAQVAGARALA